jgi:hypothetical protein
VKWSIILLSLVFGLNCRAQEDLQIEVVKGSSFHYVDTVHTNRIYMFSWHSSETNDTGHIVLISPYVIPWTDTNGVQRAGTFANQTTNKNIVCRAPTVGFTYASRSDFIGSETFRAYFTTNSYKATPDDSILVKVVVKKSRPGIVRSLKETNRERSRDYNISKSR